MTEDTIPVPDAPEYLETAGKALWTSVLDVYELTPAEVAILETAASQRDTLDRLERAWRNEGFPMTSRGSTNQLVAHPLVAELRQHRAVYRQLLTSLKLPNADAEPEIGVVSGPMTRSESARIAANARWSRRNA